MPLYEYGCPACGHVADVRHGFDERPELKCEKCGAQLQRRFSAAPIVFKGSGFYVTDSRGSKGKTEKSDSTATTETKSETSKTERSKPEPPKPGPSTDGGTKKSSEAAA